MFPNYPAYFIVGKYKVHLHVPIHPSLGADPPRYHQLDRKTHSETVCYEIGCP